MSESAVWSVMEIEVSQAVVRPHRMCFMQYAGKRAVRYHLPVLWDAPPVHAGVCLVV